MKLKRYINFINESNNILDVSLMTNNDRKLLQEYMNILNITDYDKLPDYLKKLGDKVEELVLNFMFSPPNEINKMLKSYKIENNLLKTISMEYFDNWDLNEVDAEEALNETYHLLKSYLNEFHMLDSTDNIIILSDSEEKALPSSKVIKKYNL